MERVKRSEKGNVLILLKRLLSAQQAENLQLWRFAKKAAHIDTVRKEVYKVSTRYMRLYENVRIDRPSHS